MKQPDDAFALEHRDPQTIQHIRQLIAEQTGQAHEEITDQQLMEQVAFLMAEDPEDLCVQTLFEQQVEQSADAIALVCGDYQLTYDDLNRRANQLAHVLQTLNVGPEKLVGICIERSAALIVGLLGILKAGGAFVALDPTHPEEYRERILQHARVSVLLTHTSAYPRGSLYASSVLCLDTAWEEIARQRTSNPDTDVTSTNLAYVTYMAERGIAVEHASVQTRLHWLHSEIPLAEADRVLQHTSPMLASALVEIFWPLTCGACVVIAAEQADTPGDLRADILTYAPTMAYVSPSALFALLTGASAFPAQPLGNLRVVLCGGEPLYKEVIDTFYRHAGWTLYNLYAPPEAATEVTAYLCTPDSPLDVAPLGHATTGSVYILDRYMQPVPAGVVGELYIAGDTLARGYLHDAHATNQQFVASPFVERPGERLFRTGDRGRHMRDGVVELVGSVARQAWLGGHRIDLQLLDAAVLEEPGIRDCTVLARPTERCGQELVAYIVSVGPFSAQRLHDRLQRLFPAPLVPGAYIPVAHIPLTPEGLVDEPRLTSLPVFDADLLRRWEARLLALPGIDQVAMVVQEQAQSCPPLHLSDLLPEWNGRLDEAERGQVQESERQEPPSVAEEEPVRMACSDGGPLFIPDEAPRTLTQALLETASKYKEKGIIYIQADDSEDVQSYADLLHEATCVLRGLQQSGLGPGDTAILQVETLREHFAAFWACVLGGIIPVTVAVAQSYRERNSIVNKIYNIWDLLDHPPILCRTSLVNALNGLRTLLPMDDLRVLSVDRLSENEPSTALYESQPDDIVFYQLTSGSTGVPKCIQERHSGIISHIHGAQQFNGYTASNVSLNWLPMDHVVPILTCHLKDVYLGCTQIEIRTETILAQPLKWLDYLEKYRVTHTWSPNFGYKLVSDCLAKHEKRVWDLSSMQYFLNAGEQVTLPVIAEFLQLVAPFHVQPSAMQPSFGMAEACTCMTFQREFALAGGVHRIEKSSLSGRLRHAQADDPHAIAFVDLGGPVPGIQIRITDTDNQPVPEGVIGRFQIKGPVITPGYYKNEQANAEAFVGDGWLNSGDLGFLLNGRLTLTGREKEIIIIHGANHYCYEIEDVINTIPGVEPTFVGTCGIADPHTGTEGLVIFFTSVFANIAESMALIPTIREEVITRIGLNPLAIIPVAKKDFPKTTSGKIQRTQLKKAFQQGEFDALIKDIDIHLANHKTLPDWFYQKVWVRRTLALQTLPQRESGALLILCDSLGLSEHLQARLERAGRQVVCIESGANVARLDARHYRVDPLQKEHFIDVLQSLHADGLCITQILHLHTYSAYAGACTNASDLETSQRAINASLLHLTQALQRFSAEGQAVDFYLVSSYSQSVSAQDLIALEKLALAGLLHTIGQEFPWLRCHAIDVPVADPAANAALLVQELDSPQHDTTVAYRAGTRLIQRLRKPDWGHAAAHRNPLVQGGFYVISGGLGGVGFELARYLLQHWQARLLLVGRRSLPPRDVWASLLADENPEALLITRYQELTRLGGEVTYLSADICDQHTIERAVREQEVYYAHPLDGVFHLAGLFRERLLQEETADSFAEALRAKVIGAWVLHQLVQERPGSLFLAFSSVNGLFGGVSAGAYAAANSFLDTFAQYQHEHAGFRSYCFAWSMWDEIGMSRGSRMKELALARGYAPITRNQGLSSLLAGLSRNQASLLIGLDHTNAHLRWCTETAACGLQKGVMYFVASGGAGSREDVQGAHVSDRFRVRSTCECVRLQAMPKTPAGAIDYEQLSMLSQERQRGNPEYVAPRTHVERQLASVWQDVLGVERIGIHDSFFRLGGDSIQVLQLISKANRAAGLRFTLEQVFEHQTIAALATVALTASEDRVEAGQETITGPAPLLPSQAWFFERELPDANHFNQSLMFEVPQHTDAAALEQAVRALLHHHEALRVRFVHTESGWRQFDAGPVQVVPFSCKDMSTVPAQERDAALAAEEMKLQRGLSLTAGPLVQFALFRLGAQTPSRLLVLFHHVIIDGVSWRIILEDLQDAYQQAIHGKEIHLPPQTLSMLSWATRLSAYAQSAALQSELAYWLEKSRTATFPLPLDFPDGENRVGSARLFSVSLSAAETRALLQEATRTYRVQFDIMLLAAVTRAFAQWTGGLPLLVDLVNHGREAFVQGADVSRSVGWFSMNVPVLFEVGQTSEPGALIQTVGQQLRAAPSYQGTGYNLLRYLSADKEVREKLRAFQQARVLFSYIGRFGPTSAEQLLLGPVLESNNQDSDPEALRPYTFVITAVITAGRLNIEFFYNENMHRSGTVEALAFDCVAVLRSLIAETHPSTAPSL